MSDLSDRLGAIRSRYPGDDPLDTLAKRVLDEVGEALSQPSRASGEVLLAECIAVLKMWDEGLDEQDGDDYRQGVAAWDALMVKIIEYEEDHQATDNDEKGWRSGEELLPANATPPATDNGHSLVGSHPKPPTELADVRSRQGNERSSESPTPLPDSRPSMTEEQREAVDEINCDLAAQLRIGGEGSESVTVRIKDVRVLLSMAERAGGGIEGWMLVPKKPTGAMGAAGGQCEPASDLISFLDDCEELRHWSIKSDARDLPRSLIFRVTRIADNLMRQRFTPLNAAPRPEGDTDNGRSLSSATLIPTVDGTSEREMDADGESPARADRDWEQAFAFLTGEFGDVYRADRGLFIAEMRALHHGEPPATLTSKEQESVAKRACAEAYQVLGCLASYAGVFGTDDIERALDNLSAAANGEPLPHDDLLPWPRDANLAQRGQSPSGEGG